MNESPTGAPQEGSRSFWQELLDFFSEESLADLLSWQFWLVATLVLLVLEIVTAGFVLAAFTPGTALAALCAAFGAGMEIQIFAFSAGTLFGLIYLRPLMIRRLSGDAAPTNVDALVGAAGRVTESIPAGGLGRVHVRSEEWRATSDVAWSKGAGVRVLAVEGNTLVVGAGD